MGGEVTPGSWDSMVFLFGEKDTQDQIIQASRVPLESHLVYKEKV